jgi:hypothetical protein
LAHFLLFVSWLQLKYSVSSDKWSIIQTYGDAPPALCHAATATHEDFM